jgi:hypothetical protein
MFSAARDGKLTNLSGAERANVRNHR